MQVGGQGLQGQSRRKRRSVCSYTTVGGNCKGLRKLLIIDTKKARLYPHCEQGVFIELPEAGCGPGVWETELFGFMGSDQQLQHGRSFIQTGLRNADLRRD